MSPGLLNLGFLSFLSISLDPVLHPPVLVLNPKLSTLSP